MVGRIQRSQTSNGLSSQESEWEMSKTSSAMTIQLPTMIQPALLKPFDQQMGMNTDKVYNRESVSDLELDRTTSNSDHGHVVSQHCNILYSTLLVFPSYTNHLSHATRT